MIGNLCFCSLVIRELACASVHLTVINVERESGQRRRMREGASGRVEGERTWKGR